MRQIFVDYVGNDANVAIGNFMAGSTDKINIQFEGSCCIRQVTLGLRDVVGNANVTLFDQGPLRGNFKVVLSHKNFYNFLCVDCGRMTVCDTCVTETDVTVKWSCPCSYWSGVDRYQFNLTASDGEADFIHIDRCKSMALSEKVV